MRVLFRSNTSLTGATAQITSNYASGQDVLSFVDTVNIRSEERRVGKECRLRGTETVEKKKAALRAVTYANSSDKQTTLTRKVSFVATDGTDPSAPATKDVSVTAVNDPPVVTTSVGTTEQTATYAAAA